jgi:hypothetical protein
VVPAGHVARIGLIQMAGACEPSQHLSAHRLLHRGEVFGCQRCRLCKAVGVALGYATALSVLRFIGPDLGAGHFRGLTATPALESGAFPRPACPW